MIAPLRIDALDVPAATVVAQSEAGRVLVAALATTHSPSDRAAYIRGLDLLAHPEWCSTNADYPNWTPGGTR